MTSAKRRRANRRNARKSTGPKTAEGKARSRMNALKHGLDARTPILPGEDKAAFRARLDAWKADFPPRNPQEECLLEEAARLSWQLDRAERVQAAFLADCTRLAGDGEARRRDQEAADAAAIGQRLILGANRIGLPTRPDDPDRPEWLLRRLESSAAGCRWLLKRWAELWLALLSDDDAHWQPYQRLRAVRLLGKQTVDAVDDPMVQRIYLCCFVLDPNGPEVFADRDGIMSNVDFEYFLQRLAARRVSESVPPDRGSARDGLLALVEGVIADLDARAARHAATAEREAASAPARLAFDDSPEGRRLRQIPQRLLGSLLRTIALLMKVRRHPDTPGPRPEPDRNLAANPSEPSACENLRNEPTAEPIQVGRAFQPDPDRTGSDGVDPESPTRTEPDNSLAASPDEPVACENLRNEPTAAAIDVIAVSTPRNATTSDEPGDPPAGRGPSSAVSGRPRSP